MESFVPNKRHLREALLFCFHLKISAAKSHRMLKEAYGEHALDDSTCRRWFRQFKVGIFDIEDAQRPGQQKKFEDAELQQLLNENNCQTRSQLADALNVTRKCISHRLKVMGIVYKEGKWVPRELSDGHSYLQ